jgi:hypothetical protein
MDKLNRAGMIFFVVFLTLLNLTGIVLMLIKFAQIINQDIKSYVSIGVITLCIIACTFRIIFLFDPYNYWHAIGKNKRQKL